MNDSIYKYNQEMTNLYTHNYSVATESEKYVNMPKRLKIANSIIETE